MKKPKTTLPEISDPTDDQIEETRQRVNKRYDIVIHQEDAKKLAKLYDEIEWWFTVEKFSRSQRCISINTAKEIREYFKKVEGKDMTLDEAHDYSKNAYAKTMVARKEKIAREIKKLLNKYQD